MSDNPPTIHTLAVGDHVEVYGWRFVLTELYAPTPPAPPRLTFKHESELLEEGILHDQDDPNL